VWQCGWRRDPDTEGRSLRCWWRLLAPAERRPSTQRNGNGGNRFPPTLSVFFFFGEGVRRTVAFVAGPGGLFHV
jgi:hypothetical protein